MYMDRLPGPVLAIPGNHDQPLYWSGLGQRLTNPWASYRKFIHAATETTLELPGLFVVGMNTNHPIIPGGVWLAGQRQWLGEQLGRAPSGACKVLVMHHHLLWGRKYRPFGHWFPTRHLDWLARLGVELVLNGHTHIPVTERTPQGVVVAQAGTCMSGRVRRGHGNTYNRIEITDESIRILVMGYDEQADRFVERADNSFAREKRPGHASQPSSTSDRSAGPKPGPKTIVRNSYEHR
jgi:3',5'-cyclic AMP phosphodiesterase CpdA